MKRLPRKTKKNVKKMFKTRYGFNWLKCENIISMYNWLCNNPLGYDKTKYI